MAGGLRAAVAALYKWTYKYNIINTKIVTLAFSLSHSRIYELPGRVLDTKTLIPLCAYDVYARIHYILIHRTSRRERYIKRGARRRPPTVPEVKISIGKNNTSYCNICIMYSPRALCTTTTMTTTRQTLYVEKDLYN